MLEVPSSLVAQHLPPHGMHFARIAGDGKERGSSLALTATSLILLDLKS